MAKRFKIDPFEDVLPERKPKPTGVFAPAGQEWQNPEDVQSRKMASIVDQRQKLIQSRTPGLSEAASARLAQQEVAPKPDTTFEEDITRPPIPAVTGTIEGEDVASFQAREQERLAGQEAFREGAVTQAQQLAAPEPTFLPSPESRVTAMTTDAELADMAGAELAGQGKGNLEPMTLYTLGLAAKRGDKTAQETLRREGVTASYSSLTNEPVATTRMKEQIIARPGGIQGLPVAERKAIEQDKARQLSVLKERRDELQAQRSWQFKEQIASQKYRQTEATIKATQVSTTINILKLKDASEPSELAKLDAQFASAAVEGQIAQGAGEAAIGSASPEVTDRVLDNANATVETRKAVENQRVMKASGGAQGLMQKLVGREVEAVATTSTQIEGRREAFNDVISENPDMTINEVASKVYKDAIADKDLSDKAQENIAAAISSLAQEYVATGTEPAMRELQEKATRNRVNVAVGYAAIDQSISAQKDKGVAYGNMWKSISSNMTALASARLQYQTKGQEQVMFRETSNFARTLAQVNMNPDITGAQVDELFKMHMVSWAGDNPAFQNEIANQFALLDAGKPTSPEFEKARNDFSAVMTKGHASVNLAKDKKSKELAKEGLYAVYEEGTSNVDETFMTLEEAQTYSAQTTAGKDIMKAERAVEKVKIAKSSSVSKGIKDSLDIGIAYVPVPASGDMDRLLKAQETLLGMSSGQRSRNPETVAQLEQNIAIMNARMRYQKGPSINMNSLSNAEQAETLIGMSDIIRSHAELIPEDRDALLADISLKLKPLLPDLEQRVPEEGKKSPLKGWYKPPAKEPAAEAPPTLSPERQELAGKLRAAILRTDITEPQRQQLRDALIRVSGSAEE